jgi:hypothetical protein
MHKCYFCNYCTPYKNNFRTHIMKKNKCSYLINHATINSIEDYYNLRDLHKNEPDNVIFGVELDETPPTFFESDEDSNLDSEEKEHIEQNKKYIE